MFEVPAKAGMAAGLYPERADAVVSQVDEVCLDLVARARRLVPKRRLRLPDVAALAGEHEAVLLSEGSEARARRVQDLRLNLRRHGFSTRRVAESFALVRAIAQEQIGMRHHDTQIMGGWVLLSGRVAEMETGEGKTLTATLAAATAALAGVPVHVVTANDYLAARDAELMGPVYAALGLRVGVATAAQADEERRAAYRCDVTYCTNKTVAFDYLRDRISLGERSGFYHLELDRLERGAMGARQLFLRGLYFAIVDEADSILIDEARTPLIISRESRDALEGELVHQALQLAGNLQPGQDYRVNAAERRVTITQAGRERLGELGTVLGGWWAGRRRREERVRQALAALHLYERDRHYLVRDGKVLIIDEYTGRVMPDRSWERGLHQMVEAKEGCDVSGLKETLARISYQRFFRRYHHLAGMTGTAREAASELDAVYRLPVVAVPTHRPKKRACLPTRVFPSEDEKLHAVVERALALRAKGRPVLVGTRSVKASEQLSALLQQAGVPHQVLNARQDQDEATIVAAAGERGRITIATNMAGRGTDIKLGEGVEEAGGLHVVLTERHEARRIDRQLAGRCARQGDRGSFEEMLSLEDELVLAYLHPAVRALGRGLGYGGSRASQRVLDGFVRLAQWRAERLYSRMRRGLLKSDRLMGATLAFAGRPE